MDTTNTRKPKILYIEDDATLAMIYTARFEAEGYEVKHCAEGDKALQIGRDFRPDMIVMDLMVPALSGFDALDMFRNTLETKAAKIVVMSALSQPADIKKVMDLGADDYLIKSQVLIDDVMKRVRDHFVAAGIIMAAPEPA